MNDRDIRALSMQLRPLAVAVREILSVAFTRY